MKTNNNKSSVYGGSESFKRKAKWIYRIVRRTTISLLVLSIIGISVGFIYKYTDIYIGFCGFSIVSITVLIILLFLKEEVISCIYDNLLKRWYV